MCHCERCQRKTGSSYNLGAWFPDSDVTRDGPELLYLRSGDAGFEVRFHFCPICGTTVYWEMSEGGLPGQIGVAAGCFADPDFPAPMLSVYEKRRHRWLSLPAEIPCFMEAAGGDPDERR